MTRSAKTRLQRWAALSLFVIAAFVAGCGDDDGEEQNASATTQGTQVQTEDGLEEFIRADFEEADADGNGTLDRGEAESDMRADFKDMDLNGDGVVTLEDVQAELDRAGGGKAGNSLTRYLPYDTNGDGKITEQEYVAEVSRQVSKLMDRDGSGDVTLEEGLAFHTARSQPGG